MNIGASREALNLYSGRKIEIHKIRLRHPEKFEPEYWLVDQCFILNYLIEDNDTNLKKFNLDKFLSHA